MIEVDLGTGPNYHRHAQLLMTFPLQCWKQSAETTGGEFQGNRSCCSAERLKSCQLQGPNPEGGPEPPKNCKCLAKKSLPVCVGSPPRVLAPSGALQGHLSFKRVAAHKLLESSCGFMPFAFSGIWARMAGTISFTSGATSFN